MSIYEHAADFAGFPVRDYDPDEGIIDPQRYAHRLSIDYDASEDGQTMTNLLASFIEDPDVQHVRALVIGAWEKVYESGTASERIVEALVAASNKLTSLNALFLGDIVSEECEISWIQQTDVTPLFEAYPLLEHFRVRGGTGLVIGAIRHENLKSLIVETGGLDAEVVRGIGGSDLPRLEHLELWIGTDGYGRTVTMADLAPIFRGEVLPALRYLGLCNCENADELAVSLTQAPIVSRIKVLDISLGDLTDEGAKALAACFGIARLEKLDIHHHYISPEEVAALEALGIAVDASDSKENDDDYRYIAVSE